MTKVRILAAAALAAISVSACAPYDPYYYNRPVAVVRPAPVVSSYSPPYYTAANCEYYQETPTGPVCVRSHPEYGYVYTGGPGVVYGAPVPVGLRVVIGGGHGGWRRWR